MKDYDPSEWDDGEPDHDPGYDPFDDWWAKHEREQAVKEANAVQPARPDPVEQPEYQSPEEELEASLLRGSAILDIPPPEALLGEWLNLDTLAVMYGPPKKGKSFVAIDMALCIASGHRWHGQQVAAGPVLYVIAEGVRGIGKRVRAWSKINRTDVPDDIVWLPRPVSLLNPQWSASLAAVASRIRPVMVVIDTLNRSMAGGDENSSKDMSVVVAAADHIKRATGACVLIIHHSGKDVAQGARGHSSLLGAIDTELEVKSAEGVIFLTNTAQKDAAESEPLRFTLTPALDTDSVAITAHAGYLGDDGRTLGQGCQKALDILDAIQVPGGISASAWEETCKEEEDIGHSSFFRYRARLLELELVANVGTERAPRYMTSDAWKVSPTGPSADGSHGAAA